MFLDEAAKAKAMIHRSFPDLSIEHIEFAGEGLDSRSFFVNDTYIFRFPKFPKVAKDLEIEIALLPKLRKHVHIPIPEFRFIGRAPDGALLFVGYRKIEGTPLQELWHNLGADVQEKILRMLGVFLREVHSFPVAEARNCGVQEQNFRRVYQGDFEQVAKDIHPLISEEERTYLEKLYAQYLSDERNFAYTPTFLHADFGPGHIFCDEKGEHIRGIIDFGDISIGDPDYDFMYLYGVFGWGFVLRFLRHCPRSHLDLGVLRQKLRLLLIHNTVDDIWIGVDRNDQSMKEWALSNLKRQIQEMRGGSFY